MDYYSKQFFFVVPWLLIPTYGSHGALMIQLRCNGKGIRIDLSHSMKRLINFGYSIEVCLFHGLANDVRRGLGKQDDSLSLSW